MKDLGKVAASTRLQQVRQDRDVARARVSGRSPVVNAQPLPRGVQRVRKEASCCVDDASGETWSRRARPHAVFADPAWSDMCASGKLIVEYDIHIRSFRRMALSQNNPEAAAVE
jgi:hypothetical protein